MDLQDRKPSAPVGRTDVDLPVEAAGAEQGGIENVLAVGRGDDDDAFVCGEAVHLDEQLVERLFALVVAAAEASAALTADRIDLIDEDDGRGHPLGLLKEVADTARADADIEFDEVRAGNGKKCDVRLTGNGAGQQRLAGARRADEQYALRDLRAELLEAVRVAEKLHDLRELFLFLVCTGDVLKVTDSPDGTPKRALARVNCAIAFGPLPERFIRMNHTNRSAMPTSRYGSAVFQMELAAGR